MIIDQVNRCRGCLKSRGILFFYIDVYDIESLKKIMNNQFKF